jgi:hypothetical protein
MSLAHWSRRAAPLLVVAFGCHPPPGGVAPRDASIIDEAGDADAGPGTDAGSDAPPGDGAPPGRHAIAVTTTSATVAADGACSLPEAIAASNSHTSGNGDCEAGTGDDVIELPAGTYEMTATLAPAESVEIHGTAMADTVVAFGGAASACGVSVAAPGKQVQLTSLTLRPTTGGATPAALTGVCVAAGTVRVRHARVTAFTGGGLRAAASGADEAKIEIYNSLVDGNSNAGDGGGVAYVGAPSWIAISQSAIVGNTSGGLGGGVFGAGGSNANYIINTTISGNAARRGGGIAAHVLDQTYLGVLWSTVVFNHAGEVGGGLDLDADSNAANAFVIGAIVASNTADGDAAQANLNADWGGSFSCGTSIFDVAALPRQPGSNDGSCRYDVSDAKLGPLMDMGGVDHLPVHPLLPGSPAIDLSDQTRPFGVVQQRDAWNGTIDDPPLGDDPGDTPTWSLFGPELAVNPLADSGAYELDPRWETELLAVVDLSAAGHGAVTVGGAFSKGAGTRLDARRAGDFVTYQVPVPEAGSYGVAARIRSDGGTGTFQLSVAEAPSGPFVPIGSPRDGYAAAYEWQLLDLGSVSFATAGQKFFRFTMTGKNDASSGYDLTLDYLSVTKS